MLSYLENKLLKFNERFIKPRIYILPTRVGLYFSCVIFILFTISFSYGHSLAYSTSFILVSVLVISLPYTNYNINNISLRLPSGHYQYEGEGEALSVTLLNLAKKERYDIALHFIIKGKAGQFEFVLDPTDLADSESKSLSLNLNSLPMGRYRELRVRIKSSFPFGLFYSWSYRTIAIDLCVFPPKSKETTGIQVAAISIHHHLKKQSEQVSSGHLLRMSEHDDFSRHGPFSPGHSFGRVDWKLFARSGQLYIKEFEGDVPHYLRLEVSPSAEALKSKACKLAGMLAHAIERGAICQVIAVDFDLSTAPGHGSAFERETLKRVVEKLEELA